MSTLQPDELLEAKELTKFFPITSGLLRRRTGSVKAVDAISFSIARGETLGLVGESGSGKTTTGRLLLRAIEPTGGQVLFQTGEGTVDVASLSKRELRNVRRHIQMIFQDPHSSLNPRMTIGEIVAEPLLVNNVLRSTALREKVADLLEEVGLDPSYMSRYPHAFSGGQRQRVGIARALALEPKLIVADEPVSALDVSVQAQILNLMTDLRDRFNLTYLFISHDLGVVRHICDRVAVMYVGKLVEIANVKDLFAAPKHPYSEALLSAVPSLDPDKQPKQIELHGDIADPSNRPSGCAFHPRCAYAKEICTVEEPPLVGVASNTDNTPTHFSACHFTDELQLLGIESPLDG